MSSEQGEEKLRRLGLLTLGELELLWFLIAWEGIEMGGCEVENRAWESSSAEKDEGRPRFGELIFFFLIVKTWTKPDTGESGRGEWYWRETDLERLPYLMGCWA